MSRFFRPAPGLTPAGHRLPPCLVLARLRRGPGRVAVVVARRDRFPPVAEEVPERDRQIENVSHHFHQRRVAVVAEEGRQEAAKAFFLVEDRVDVPHVLDDDRDDARLLQLVDAVGQ